ncbi:MAG: ABC transporter substrate-binding protein [Salinibacterium sp.]|nr:ABC transporter substrate-binding protein [Salinibacterium sp.]
MTKQSRGRTALTLRATAVVTAGLVSLTGCVASEISEPVPTRTNLTLSIGTLLPGTGSMAMFGPSTIAGATLAAQDINDAGLGITVTIEYRDSGDSASETGVTSATELLDLGVSAIVGAVSSGVSRKVIDQITGAGVVQISPANSAADFTGYADDGLYWRTAPSCVREGAVLGAQAATDGAETLGIVSEQGFCGDALPLSAAAAFESEGGVITGNAVFDPTVGGFDAQVAAVVAEAPDAIAVISGAQARAILPRLTAAGYTGENLYFIGMPIGELVAENAGGAVTGTTATMAGLDLSTLTDFTDRILEFDPAVQDFGYAAETYDAVILLALAALAARDTSGRAIADSLQEVSGGSGDGEKATDFEAAATIILEGRVVDYDGLSGPITFDENGDPTEGVIGVYRYTAANQFVRIE